MKRLIPIVIGCLTIACAGNSGLQAKVAELEKANAELKAEALAAKTTTPIAPTPAKTEPEAATVSEEEVEVPEKLKAPSANGIYVIAFGASDSPCKHGTYEAGLEFIAQEFSIDRGYLPPLFVGQCLTVTGSKYWIRVKVNDVPMIARFKRGGIPKTECTTNAAGQPGPYLPLIPPGQVLDPKRDRFVYTKSGTAHILVPRGKVKITYELYQQNPTGHCFSLVETRMRVYPFPHTTSRYGWTQQPPEIFVPRT